MNFVRKEEMTIFNIPSRNHFERTKFWKFEKFLVYIVDFLNYFKHEKILIQGPI